MPFTRQNKRLILTKEGIMLLELANNLLLNADHALQTMKELSDNKTLNLGVPPMLSSFILPILYRDFFKNYPDFRINIIEDDRTGLIRMLDEHKINMAFLPLVLFKNSFFQTERILERFNQSGYNPNILLQTAQVTTMQNMAAIGLAVGFIFKFLLESTSDLVGIPLDPPMRTQISLVWKQGEHLSNNMNHLIQFVKKYSRNNARALN